MSFKKTLWLIVGCLFVGGIISFQHNAIKRLSNECDIYKNNTNTLLSGVELLKKDSAGKAYQIQTMALDLKELKEHREQDIAEIKSLKIKLKRLQAISKQQMEISAPIKAAIKDSIYITDTVVRYMPVICYQDKHISFKGEIHNDSLTAKINIPVTLTQVIYKVPKRKFLWWEWGCKAVKQVITTDNPYININYAEYIELKK